MTLGVTEPAARSSKSQAIALSPSVGSGQDTGLPPPWKYLPSGPKPGLVARSSAFSKWDGRGRALQGRKCLGLPEFQERDLCLRSVFFGYLQSPTAFRCYPSMTQTVGTRVLWNLSGHLLPSKETEDEMIGWPHQLNRHESEQILGESEGQGSLACCSPWACRVRHHWVTKQQKSVRVEEIGSPERRRREQIWFSPTPPMSTHLDQ